MPRVDITASRAEMDRLSRAAEAFSRVSVAEESWSRRADASRGTAPKSARGTRISGSCFERKRISAMASAVVADRAGEEARQWTRDRAFRWFASMDRRLPSLLPRVGRANCDWKKLKVRLLALLVITHRMRRWIRSGKCVVKFMWKRTGGRHVGVDEDGAYEWKKFLGACLMLAPGLVRSSKH